MGNNIHPSAIVESQAVLDADVTIGPYAVVGPQVRLGKGVVVGPHAHIKGQTTIGEGTVIGSHAVIGELPQVVGLKEAGRLRIGKNNVLREYVTIHTARDPQKETVLGDNNFLMLFAHVGHDVIIHDNVVLCPFVMLAGHVEVFDRAFVSGGVAVHQFVRLGRAAMVSGLSRVNQDVPPFMLLVGDSRIWGINTVGAKRIGLKMQELSAIKFCHSALYREKLSVANALEKIKNNPSPLAKEIASFIETSERGICGPKVNSFWERLFIDYPYFARHRLDIWLQYRSLPKD
jgi:UDP-N-acetylglucosamine acyltransferase